MLVSPKSGLNTAAAKAAEVAEEKQATDQKAADAEKKAAHITEDLRMLLQKKQEHQALHNLKSGLASSSDEASSSDGKRISELVSSTVGLREYSWSNKLLELYPIMNM